MPFFARSDKVAGVVTFEANVPDGEIVARAPGLEKKDKMLLTHKTTEDPEIKGCFKGG